FAACGREISFQVLNRYLRGIVSERSRRPPYPVALLLCRPEPGRTDEAAFGGCRPPFTRGSFQLSLFLPLDPGEGEHVGTPLRPRRFHDSTRCLTVYEARRCRARNSFSASTCRSLVHHCLSVDSRCLRKEGGRISRTAWPSWPSWPRRARRRNGHSLRR